MEKHDRTKHVCVNLIIINTGVQQTFLTYIWSVTTPFVCEFVCVFAYLFSGITAFPPAVLLHLSHFNQWHTGLSDPLTAPSALLICFNKSITIHSDTFSTQTPRMRSEVTTPGRDIWPTEQLTPNRLVALTLNSDWMKQTFRLLVLIHSAIFWIFNSF